MDPFIKTAFVVLLGLVLAVVGTNIFIEHYLRPDASITITLPSGPDVFQP